MINFIFECVFIHLMIDAMIRIYFDNDLASILKELWNGVIKSIEKILKIILDNHRK